MSADTPGVKTQLNFKTSQGTLVNVYLYSYDEEEIRKSLEAIANVVPEINAVETLYNAQGTLKAALNATAIEYKNSPSPVSSTGGRACKHGAMVLRTGTNDRGPWSGYMCPEPKESSDRCKPQYVR
jgi:hypothetical protein